MIEYVQGDATRPLGSGPKIIVHVCNDIGAWGRGFVLALSKRWPGPESEYKKQWKQAQQEKRRLELGHIQVVTVEDDILVVNIIGQRGLRSRRRRKVVVYDAVREGLVRVRKLAKSIATVHMPRIGCGLAGGDWSVMEKIVQEELADHGIPVTVYDF